MKLFFRKYGEGTPLIILHGLFGSADNWNTMGKKFGEHFTTYLVDQRNHGQSPHSETWNYTAMAEDILELMEDEQIDKAHLMGHSMGGKTVMFSSMMYPERIEKLIVSDIAPRYYPVHHQEILQALESVDLDKITSRKEAEAIIEPQINDFGTRQFLLKNLYWKDEKLAWRFNLDVISRKIEAVGEVLPVSAPFTHPALFVRGEKSNYITDEDWIEIKTIYPRADLYTMPGAGHWVHAEKPVEYFDLVMNFLK